MRCLRQIQADNSPPKQETATVYLSQANYLILDAELNKNFNMSIKDLSNKNKKSKEQVKVSMIPPKRFITIREKRYDYFIKKNDLITPIDFELEKINLTSYQRTVTEKQSLTRGLSNKKTVITDIKDNIFSAFTLVAEIARFFPDTGPLKIDSILENSKTGFENILRIVNDYNEVLYDRIIPKIFNSLYEITSSPTETERTIVLLKNPTNPDYYLFYADPSLVISSKDNVYEPVKNKSFHADNYCFDSKPEIECFRQYLWNENVESIYFTGMFTSLNQNDLSIPYTDPDSHRLRNYYPDFIAKMKDGSIQIIEVKGDNKLDDNVVKAKQEAALALTTDNDMIYRMLAGSRIMNSNIVDIKNDNIIAYPETS
jgi:hypothetical protein